MTGKPASRKEREELAQLRAEAREDPEVLITRILNLRAENDKLKATVSERGTPFGWWDIFNETFYRDERTAKFAEQGGNKIKPLYERPER